MPEPLGVVPELVVFPVDERNKFKALGFLNRWVAIAAFRLNSLWTGDSQIVTTDAGGVKTITFKKRYSKKPLVLLTVEEAVAATTISSVEIPAATNNIYLTAVIRLSPAAAKDVHALVIAQ